jgi:hypothetical protein
VTREGQEPGGKKFRGEMVMLKRSLSVLVLTLIAVFALDASAATVRLCRHSTGAYEYADNANGAPASEQFQRCIDDTTVTGLNLEPGTYQVDAPIVVWRKFSIGTAGLAGDTRGCQQLPGSWCARLLASDSKTACINDSTKCMAGRVSSGGLLQALGAPNVVFDHLIIDGNRAARYGTQSWANCAIHIPTFEGNVYGFNAKVDNCGGTPATRCEFTYNLTQNALCGTGLQWRGDYGRVQGNAAYNNGISDPNQKRWSDGLTILRNNGGIISDNHIVNSTDVGLILGAANGAYIQSNWIEQPNPSFFAFAAMMLGNFKEGGGAGQTGDYRNAMVRYNTINCYGLNCGIGLNLGPDPWSPPGVDYENIYGGMITQNSINGARMDVNFGGAGKYGIPVTVTNNTLTGASSGPIDLYPGISRCVNPGGFVQNLPNNNREGECGNYGIVDPVPTSAICFKQCWP